MLGDDRGALPKAVKRSTEARNYIPHMATLSAEAKVRQGDLGDPHVHSNIELGERHRLTKILRDWCLRQVGLAAMDMWL